jgi:autotransporter-associated beta strand protein
VTVAVTHRTIIMNTFGIKLARVVTVGLLLASAAVAPAAAQTTRTWKGAVHGDPWSVAANWDPVGAPVDGDSLIFDATGSTGSENDLPDIAIDTITVSGTSHTVTGSAFRLASGITGRLGSLPTITLDGDQTWTTASGGISPAHVVLNGHEWTVSVDGFASVTTAMISGTGSIVKSGTGELDLTGDNTFSGPLTIEAGYVQVRSANGLGVGDGTPANGTTVNAGGRLRVGSVLSLTLDDEALTLQGTGGAGNGALEVQSLQPVTFTGPITLAATTRIWAGTGPGSRNLIFNAPLKGPGDLVIVDGTIVTLGTSGNTLTGVDFAGDNTGTIRVGFRNALSTARVNLPAGATLDVNDSGTDVLGLDGAGTVTIGPTGGSLTVKNTLPSTFTGTISGVNGILIKDGPGVLTLGGSNTFAHGPRIDAGTLRVTHPNALGAGGGTQATGTSVLTGATLALDNVTLAAGEFVQLGTAGILQVMGTNPSAMDGPVVMIQSGAITGTDGATLTFNGQVMIGPQPVSITNAHVVMTNSTNGIEGPVTVNAGATLAAGAAGALQGSTHVALNGGVLALNSLTIMLGTVSGNGTVAFGTNGTLQLTGTTDATFAGTSTGTGSLIKSGIGAWTLSGPFAASGQVSITGGSLILAHAQALQGTPKVTVALGASLIYAAAATVPYEIAIDGSGSTGVNGAVQVLGGNVTFTGPFSAADFFSLLRVDAPHVMTLAGPLTFPSLYVGGSGTLLFGTAGHDIPFMGIGINSNNVPVGSTTVRPGVAGALGPVWLKVGAGATFDLNGFDQTATFVQGEGTIAIGAKTLTTQNSTQFEGVFTGTGTIDATGTSLSVSGTSTFNGTVTAASFENQGTLPASVHVTDITMRLMPNSVTGPVSVAPGVFLIAGDADTPGGVTTGDLHAPADAIVSAYLQAATTITVHGTVTLGGQLNPFLHPSVSTPPQVITLIDNDGTDPVVGTFADFSEGSVVGVDEATYGISYVGGTGNDVTLTRYDATYFLSEGATGAFFDTDLLIANPHNAVADVSVEFYREDGELEGFLYHIAPESRITIRVDELEGMESATFSTIVRSNNPALNLIVERTMRWDATGYGAHTEKATNGPALKWYFAEGSEGFFRTYLLLANPDLLANTATVTYLREGEPSITRTYELEPGSRRTIQAADDPELVGRSFGMTVEFARRGIAERAMYFGTNPIWKGGHESLGETMPSQTWFLAEGATGAGFDTFILVANPNADPADVTYTFLSDSAGPATITRTIPGLSRHTVNIEAEGLSIPDGPVATQITATLPVIAERAQYWPGSFDQWTETHNSFGVTQPGLKWGLAEGRAGGPESYQTYILLANAGTENARVEILFLGDGDSETPSPISIDVPAQRRVNIPVFHTGAPDDPATTFGAIIGSDKPIVVERAMYWNVNGEEWAAGTNATATRLP